MPLAKRLNPSAKQLLAKEEEDLLEKGLQLAYFIIPDRTIALRILSGATSKLKAQRSREKKRAYWRDKHLKRRVTRVIRDKDDALQWLIYFEAEEHEKHQEQAGEQTARDMVVRYIKCLVQAATAMSSFYVSIGLQRVLRNYSTTEARQAYEWVTQRYPGDPEYRKVKSTLMNRLEMRFTHFIRTCTTRYGELRFEALEEQESLVNLVDECLRIFIPWSTSRACELLASSYSNSGNLPYQLSGANRGSVDQDMIENHQSHVFIDPTCYGHLTSRLGLNSPDRRLTVPRFFFGGKSEGQGHSGESPGNAPVLTEAERREITVRLEAESDRRRRVSPKLLRILVDGTECARLDSRRESEGGCDVQDGAKLIEIWAEDDSGDLLLATHWVEYTSWHGIASATATVDLGHGRELFLQITPEHQGTDVPGGASIRLKCRPVSRFATLREAFDSRFWLHRLPRYALASLVFLGLGWILGTVMHRHELFRQQMAVERLGKELANEKAAKASLEKAIEIERLSASIETYTLVPDDLRVRGQQGADEPVVSISSRASSVFLQLPVEEGYLGSYRVILKPFAENHEVLSENFVKPAPMMRNGIFKFMLPASLLEGGRHYVVTLDSMNSSGHIDRVRTFTFYVVKK
jgi:hypothetical protein